MPPVHRAGGRWHDEMGHYPAVSMPEDGPLAEIESFFAEHGLTLSVHQEPLPPLTADQARGLSREVRVAHAEAERWSHWVDLCSASSPDRPFHPRYGGGSSADEAIRSARRRWRIEQDG